MKSLLVKKLLAASVVGFMTVFSLAAQAGEFGDLMSKVRSARSSVLTMLEHEDQRGADQQKLVKDTADAVSVAFAKMKAPAGKEAQFKEMSETLTAFMNTREEILVPYILDGKEAQAKELARGIQKERYLRILVLSNQLDK